jgi:gamma-glutamylcyclotransferase (GGCT)/AIG2-like uncharacterized protein YtfP
VTTHLFVYGSLRADARHPMHGVLASGAVLDGVATVIGKLYAVSWYPGLVLADDGHDVHGELWRIIDRSILAVLDAYEGCGPNDVPPFEFGRTTTQATRPSGDRVSAWVWVYTGVTDESQRVGSGDWLHRDG